MRGPFNSRHHRTSKKSASIVADFTSIAVKFDAISAAIIGLVGFSIFYAIVPYLIVAWLKAAVNSETGSHVIIFSQVFDELLFLRIIRPCQITGIGILFACSIIALWKIFQAPRIDRSTEKKVSLLARIVARILG